MNRPKVFLTGGDGIGWALDDDLGRARRALESIADFTDLEQCDVVHSVWWDALLSLPAEKLAGKRILCHVPGEPFRYMALNRFRKAAGIVGCWIAQTNEAARQFVYAGVANVRLIPYTIDVNVFRPLPAADAPVAALREQYHIPKDRYLIGNFHRDSEGRDLRLPKLSKGPDVLAEILALLGKRGLLFHAVLAGPRRHWLRDRLARLGVPFTFVGQPTDDDDIGVNTLPREKLNLLWNLIDLYVVSSRSEGGPLSVLEAAASRCRILSTPVGLARDVLDPACIYRSPPDAARSIERDIRTNWLAAHLEAHFGAVQARHRVETSVPLFRDLYGELERITPHTAAPCRAVKPPGRVRRLLRRVIPLRRARMRVCLWHKFYPPPYGGGNQFMLALRKSLMRKGVRVAENRVGSGIGAYLLNSIQFDLMVFRRFRKSRKLNVVHRVDGPISLIRGCDRDKDDLCFRLNQELAGSTVVQSAWCLRRIIELGYRPVNPVIIHNAVDGDIFHRVGRVEFDPARKTRLVSSSWSDNPRKGGPTYKWIDRHLDWDRFEYTFVGRASESFDHIREIPPVPQEELARILRQHDVYITASRNDPCSNAVLEALACGLPVLYLDDGGHPELVGQGGLPFTNEEEILSQLDALLENYSTFQNLIVVPDLDEVAGKYLELLKEAAGRER